MVVNMWARRGRVPEGGEYPVIFIDLSKVFDPVDHQSTNKLQSSALDVTLLSLTISNGEPQGSVLGPSLFTLYINIILPNHFLKVNFYADDAVVFASGSSPARAHLQSACDVFQLSLLNHRNADNTTYMIFFNSKSKREF